MKVTTVEVRSKTIMKKGIQKPKKLPTSILTIFLTYQSIIGYDFGFHDVLRREIRNIFKYYSKFICFVAFIVFGIPLVFPSSRTNSFMVINMAQFVGNVIALQIAKYNMYHFITDIRAININVRSKENFGGVIACAFCFIICTFNLVVRFIICSFGLSGCTMSDNWLVQILYNVFRSCLDIMHVIQTLVNYYTFCAVKNLKHLVDNEKSYISDIRKQFVYIADCCDKIRPLYGNLVSDCRFHYHKNYEITVTRLIVDPPFR